MPRNEHHEDDVLYVTQATRSILLALGAWPFIGKERSAHSRAHSLPLICMSYLLLSCDIIPGVLLSLMAETTRIRLQTIPFLLYDFMTAGQYGIFLLRQNQLRQCLKHVEEDWENVFSADARNIMLKSARIGRRLIVICGFFMYSGVFTFRTILPLSHGKIVTDQNITIRYLACPGIVIASVVTSACNLTAIFVVHACGQLRILIGLMKSLVRKQWRTEREVDEKLAEIVEHQIRVRSFLKLVQHTLNEVYVMEITVNTLAICILVYFMISDFSSTNIGILCSYFISIINVVIHIFLFCYTGEQLTTQAEKVATTSCELEWYRLPSKKARSVVILMIMSNTPTKISASKFVDLLLKTFGDVMKTAGAYFNMLRSVME